MNKRTVVITLILVAFVAVAATLFLKRGSSADETLKPFQALGAVAAQETAKLVGGSGPILLIGPDFGGVENPAYQAQMDAFRKELEKTRGVTIAASETISMGGPQFAPKSSTLRFLEPAASRGPAGPQPGQLGQLLANNPQAKAVVYFVGLPEFNRADLTPLKQQGTKLIVVADWRPEYKSLFKSEVLHLAVVPRWEPHPNSGKKPRTTKDWFEQSYAVVTPDTAEAVP